ncbi:MAG: ATPase [Tannerella sp.]|jgi:V/A-type H+-transporting ATPase subunit I|nr:ATPase [Tannerella sp.]
MIVKMDKYAFLVYHKEYDAFLERLRSLGVVHVKETKPTAGHDVIVKLTAENRRVTVQLEYLDGLLKAKTKVDDARQTAATEPAPDKKRLSPAESGKLLGQVEELRDRLDKNRASMLLAEKERDAISAWGDFSYDTLEKLREAGYAATFFTCPESHYDEAWERDCDIFVINRTQSAVHFIAITPSGAAPSIDADRAKMPLKDYRHIMAELEAGQKYAETLEAELLDIARNHYDSLKGVKTDIENETAWNNVLVQTDSRADDKLMFLEGWIPVDRTAEMETSLADAGYFCLKQEITDEDDIPVKLKNNRIARLFEPVTKLYSLPNYHEFDSTPLFAPFFMLFFGMCLCDGGYGLLLILITGYLKRKAGAGMRPILSLLQCFGVATLAVGIVTGSFFGVSLVNIEYFSSLKKYFVSSDSLMIISIMIGFFHVMFGKFVAACKIKAQRGMKHSLSAFAWIFLILAFAGILALPMMNVTLSPTVRHILYGIAALSALVAFLYNTPGKNVFLNFGSGLWATYNTASGLVGDVLSYIRLYAIGLTGGLLGGVFNTIAIDMTASINPFVRWLPMLLILLVGHALNIGLSMIGSLVHPLRLVYVEYYKNSEFEGGGNDYKPFKKS